MNSYRYSATVFALILLVLATCLKLLPWIPNIALFGALSIFCGAYLRGPMAWVIPLAGIMVSDLLGELLGVNGIYRYTAVSMVLNYAGFTAMVGVGHILRKRDSWDRVLGTSLIGSATFFLISNFGCWLDPILKYAPTLNGLFDCYLAAIPFFRNSLLSDVIGTAIAVAAHGAALNYQAQTTSRTAG